MALIRRRYYFWLVKAYFKRWKKTILTSVLLGGIAFFFFLFLANFYILPLIEKKNQRLGYFGTYTTSTVPEKVLNDVSYGLTKIDEDGKIKPGAAFRWQIKDGGKEYVFYIRKGQYFHDKKELNAKNLNINFKGVKKEIIDGFTVSFKLKEPYAPFLTSVSKPIIAGNFQGLGDYKIKKIELNGGFVKSLNLQNIKNSSFKKIIYFYPSQSALKTAYSLGEVDSASGITDLNMDKFSLKNWGNSDIKEYTDYQELITLFYNNGDSTFSNKKVRQALNYAVPAKFEEGQRAYSPISPKSVFFTKTPNYGISDIGIAKSTLSSIKDFKPELEISVHEDYMKAAKEIKKEWGKLGVKVKIREVNSIPRNYQILIYPMKLPQDPDQYTLWHSDQVNNIVRYKNLRIDKLLEDGRSEGDFEKRIAIYSDFQKYLIDDVPASFLYFPTKHTILRR